MFLERIYCLRFAEAYNANLLFCGLVTFVIETLVKAVGYV